MLRRRLEDVFAGLPVAGAEFIGLQRIKIPQCFLRIAALIEAVAAGNPLNGSGSSEALRPDEALGPLE